MGLLDDLKKQAEAVKAQDGDRSASLRASAIAVDEALRRGFVYLNDLGKQLNALQMPCPFTFKLPLFGDVGGLVLRGFHCDYRSKHFIDKDYMGEVHVSYRAWSDKVLMIKAGPNEMTKFRDFLWSSNIEHKSEQYRDQRRVVTHEIFKVACDFRVQAKIEGDHESGKIKIVTKNVGAFQGENFLLLCREFNEIVVEEFAKYFIGRPTRWQDLAKRSQLKVRASPPPQPLKSPESPVKRAAAPTSRSEHPAGLFGSLRALVMKGK